MTDIAIGVLIPVNIRGDHNEIIDIWVNGNQYYYYQSELTEEGVSEGLYYSEGLKVDDEDEGSLFDELEQSIIQISLN
tara:strand:+ start:352 stop:585 length:234 start_codon:yes stop_codon:yes gene_type:complete